ncbi:MAG: aspartate carbamoyltransferase, partial [Polyangiaceae bacterium]|nr:aspartate carbamoyltransferase [Polyangiaceae bacterium]
MEDTPLRHLLGIEELSTEHALSLLKTAESFLEITRRPIRKVPTLRGKTVLNVFFENSTRTRTSFELAGKRMGADVVNMSVSSSSTKKGETLYDTIDTLDAMHADVVVIRHQASGVPHLLAQRSRA